MDIVQSWLYEANLQNENNKMKKRKLLFDYLCGILSYDYILYADAYKNSAKRNIIKEFDGVFLYKKGMCNSISQVYHIMLAAIGIKSACVCCLDIENVPHELIYIYDTGLLDDITNVLIGYGTKNTNFNYSFDRAKIFGQGIKPLIGNKCWIKISNAWLETVAERSIFSSGLKKYIGRQKKGETPHLRFNSNAELP